MQMKGEVGMGGLPQGSNAALVDTVQEFRWLEADQYVRGAPGELGALRRELQLIRAIRSSPAATPAPSIPGPFVFSVRQNQIYRRSLQQEAQTPFSVPKAAEGSGTRRRIKRITQLNSIQY